MQRLARMVCGFCAALVLLTSGCAGGVVNPGTIYHSDPSTVRERYEAWLLFAHLAGALESVASQDFGRSGEQFSAVKIDRAHIPSSLVDLATRYTELCNELADTIESLYDSLEKAERMLAANDVQQAGLAIGASRSLLTQAREQLAALEDATLEVFTMLRRSGGGGTTAQLDQARASLEAALARLLQLTAEYERRADAAEASAAGKRVLTQPLLTLELDRDAVWVGETVALSGAVTVGAAPLGGRSVRVLLDGVEVGRVRSDGRGAFSHDLVIPFEYVPRHVVQVSFVPEGDDLSRFQPALSGEIVLTVRFHQSLLTVAAPARMYPGFPVALAGTVESAGNVNSRQVEVQWRGETIGMTLTRPEGGFECTVMLPDEAPLGQSVIQLSVAADDESATGPAAGEMDVEVTTLAPLLDVSVGRLLFVPALSLSLPRQLLGGDFVRMVPVTGEVHSLLPLGVVSMSADSGGRQVRWEQRDSAFQREVPLEMSAWSMGMRTITVRVAGQEPWHHPAELRARLLVVNLFIPSSPPSLQAARGRTTSNRRTPCPPCVRAARPSPSSPAG
jgi:flagellar biosynthesis chaperone FliJ